MLPLKNTENRSILYIKNMLRLRSDGFQTHRYENHQARFNSKRYDYKAAAFWVNGTIRKFQFQKVRLQAQGRKT